MKTSITEPTARAAQNFILICRDCGLEHRYSFNVYRFRHWCGVLAQGGDCMCFEHDYEDDLCKCYDPCPECLERTYRYVVTGLDASGDPVNWGWECSNGCDV